MNLEQKIEESKRTGELDISGMGLTTLPILPSSLTHLHCDLNQLTNIPVLPERLKYLGCAYNQLKTLPILPPTLTNLYCSYNQLVTLPAFPPNLTEACCSYNQYTILPVLPETLTHLGCAFNQLKTLPVLPPKLIALYCPCNQFTTLPLLPPTLKELDCSNNPYNATFTDCITGNLPETIQRIQTHYSNIKNQLRNTLALQHARKGAIRVLNEDCLNILGSYLSGKSGVLHKQIAELRDDIGV